MPAALSTTRSIVRGGSAGPLPTTAASERASSGRSDCSAIVETCEPFQRVGPTGRVAMIRSMRAATLSSTRRSIVSSEVGITPVRVIDHQQQRFLLRHREQPVGERATEAFGVAAARRSVSSLTFAPPGAAGASHASMAACFSLPSPRTGPNSSASLRERRRVDRRRRRCRPTAEEIEERLERARAVEPAALDLEGLCPSRDASPQLLDQTALSDTGSPERSTTCPVPALASSHRASS